MLYTKKLIYLLCESNMTWLTWSNLKKNSQETQIYIFVFAEKQEKIDQFLAKENPSVQVFLIRTVKH